MSEEPAEYDDEVLSISVFKGEPECVTYKYKLKTEYEQSRPEHLEQLAGIQGFLTFLIEKAEEANMNDRIDTHRKVRIEIMNERLAKEAKDADDRSTGGEPESD